MRISGSQHGVRWFADQLTFLNWSHPSEHMASFETRVTEIRADPRGGFFVRLKPHFLERDVEYQNISLEPHFDNHCASIAEDSIEVRTEHAPPVYVGQIVAVYAVEPELPSF